MIKLALIALAIAFIVTAVIGMPIINWLRKMKFGQKILEIGPKWHMNKQNIPTMGGFMFIIGITISMIISYGILSFEKTQNSLSMPLFFSVLFMAFAYGLVGMIDDWAKIRKKQNAGLTPMQKLLLQIVVAAVFISLLRLADGQTGGLWIPILERTIQFNWIVYMIFEIIVVVGCDNAVNLTDGIDGLAASVTVPVGVFFVAVGIHQQNIGVTAFAAALVGGLLGFLIFNFNPAKVFMGDTGSLFLGGAVAGLAFACNLPLVLLPVGLIYVLETLSVILQVGYFKISHGKRLFKMAPIHHHFEMCGWGERKIVFIFTLITTVMCVLAWILFKSAF